MSAPDYEYFKRRHAECIAKGRTASSPEVAKIYFDFAARYMAVLGKTAHATEPVQDSE
ncbi:hypothetical protein ACMT1E_07375 [Sphingomonas flavalba]|uniref:hypothetical protein n=1 Tax=Sphingomonas flavalba TaxID=2559804 RepID=UPI0039E1588B